MPLWFHGGTPSLEHITREFGAIALTVNQGQSMPTATANHTAHLFIRRCLTEAPSAAPDQGQDDKHAYAELRAEVLRAFDKYAAQKSMVTTCTDLMMVSAELHALCIASFCAGKSQAQQVMYAVVAEEARDAAMGITLDFLEQPQAPGTASPPA